MKRFRNILVGVDLSAGDRFVGSELSPATRTAVERGMWLAKSNSARLTFFFALDLSPQAQRLLDSGCEGGSGTKPTLVDEAKRLLTQVAAEAKEAGIEADVAVRVGKSWVETIRQVLEGGHDFVMVGTRHLGSVASHLIGSTGIKLLRKCPCPVWVTQPQAGTGLGSILVAHDLSEVGRTALELGCSLAERENANVCVLHAMEHAEAESLLPAEVPVDSEEDYRQEAERQIGAQMSSFRLAKPATVEIVTEPADTAITDAVARHGAELLVMGTVARTGIPGLITGNTAERLLPKIPCSVLAVKPAGWVSPVTL